jgi:predicted nucleic acid-binding protein
VVDFLRGQRSAIEYIRGNADRVAISVVTLAELYAGARGEAEEDELGEFSAAFALLDLTPDIARDAGRYKRRYAKSHGVGLADALIAATAEAHALRLSTLNVRHYPMLEGLKAPYRK